MIDFINAWQPRTRLPLQLFLKVLRLGRQRYRSWCQRYGTVNEHTGWILRDQQLLPEERERIIAFYQADNLEGYRRLTCRMIDADIV